MPGETQTADQASTRPIEPPVCTSARREGKATNPSTGVGRKKPRRVEGPRGLGTRPWRLDTCRRSPSFARNPVQRPSKRPRATCPGMRISIRCRPGDAGRTGIRRSSSGWTWTLRTPWCGDSQLPLCWREGRPTAIVFFLFPLATRNDYQRQWAEYHQVLGASGLRTKR